MAILSFKPVVLAPIIGKSTEKETTHGKVTEVSN